MDCASGGGRGGRTPLAEAPRVRKSVFLTAVGLVLTLCSTLLAQVQVGRYVGIWCPQDGWASYYQIQDELKEIDWLRLECRQVKQSWELTFVTSGLDSHRLLQRLDREGRVALTQVKEPDLPWVVVPPRLVIGGAQPISPDVLGILKREKSSFQPSRGQKLIVDHLTFQDGEVWLSAKIPPYGVARYKVPGLDMRLVNLERLSHESR